MKKIFFSHITSVFNIALMVIGVTAIFALNFIKDIPPMQLYWYRVMAYLVVMFFFGKIIVQNLLLKNFVGWSRQAMQIKIGTRKNTMLFFDRIKKYQFQKGILQIDTNDGNHLFDLRGYSEKSINKLLRILEKRV